MSSPVAARGDAGPVLRDHWWWQHALGVDEVPEPSWSAAPGAVRPDDDLGHDLAPGLPSSATRAWRPGSTAALAGLPYGTDPGAAPGSAVDGWERTLVSTLGSVRRDPSNPYNDHRAYPSPRCLFPVRGFARDGGRWGILDPARQATRDLAPARGAGPALLLAGRYTAIPASYGWMRGSLVGLEVGIVLRQLAVAARLHGQDLDVTPPGTDDAPSPAAALAELPLPDPGAWGPAWLVAPSARPTTAPARPAAAPRARPLDDDPCLHDLAAALGDHPVGGPRVRLPSGVPEDLVPPTTARAPVSWAEVLWRRSSGRMPRGLHGFALSSRPLPSPALADAAAWLRVAPPTRTAAAVHAATTVRVVLQGADGLDDGLHELTPEGYRLLRAAPDLPRAVEAAYGYPGSPGVGCDVRRASALWFVTVRPRDLVRDLGPSAWTAAQVATGWVAHGLCLAAAAHGLAARPVRAFAESAVADVLGLDDEEMLAIAVVVGTDRAPTTAQLDLRI